MAKKRSRVGQIDRKTASKRQQVGKGGNASLRAVPFLPQEVLEQILYYACLLPPLPTTQSVERQSPSSPLNFTASQLLYDSATALHVVLTSRSIHGQILPLLYRNIRLERPSNLAAFYSMLFKRPDLLPLVKSIHLGPRDQLPSAWWPLARTDMTIRSDLFCPGQPLRRRQEQRTLNYDAAGLPPCAPRFLADAIHSAAKDLGVVLQSPGPQETPARTRSWLIRICEVQAAAELYEGEMLRIQREERALQSRRATRSQCATMQCGHFPHLVITATRPTPLKTSVPQQDGPVVGRSKGSLFLPRSHLQAHLARQAGAGTLFDRFDHPLLFAPSGLDVCRFDGKGRPVLSYAQASEQLKQHAFATEVALDGKSFESVLKLIIAVKWLTGVSVRCWPEVLQAGVRLREEKLGWKA